MNKIILLSLILISSHSFAQGNDNDSTKNPFLLPQTEKYLAFDVPVDTSDSTWNSNSNKDFGMRIYDSRILRYHSIDSKQYRSSNPYYFEEEKKE